MHAMNQPTASPETLIEQARQVLADNRTSLFTKPSPRLYPHQWNWDSAFIALGLAHVDLTGAMNEIRSLLRGQWRNGMIPHIIYSPKASGYFPSPQRWQISRAADAPQGILTSGITQPPMITIAVRQIGKSAGGQAFVREAYGPLLAYHRWFHRERDPRGEGLVAIVHPWESGQDNSPRWIEIFNRIRLDQRPEYRRQDRQWVAAGERPTDDVYDRFVFLMDLARTLDYDQRVVLAESPFVVQDVLVNSILYAADGCLLEMAQQLGEPVEEIQGWLNTSRRAIRAKLWDEADGLYYDYDLRGEQLVRENTLGSLMPLYAGLADLEHARLVREHLTNRSEYAPDGIVSYFQIPTTSKSSRYFNPRAYWRGPIWVNMNWFMIRGLERYGYHEEARQVRQDTLSLVRKSGFHEYFDPRTAQGYGTPAFSWSAALAIDLLIDSHA